jgi:ubiquinone/menaquinone biosynthesis C-methylase UbiE
MTEEIEEWESKSGERFLRTLGVKQNHVVIDFGCRIGAYTLPAARIVGDRGVVYALDTDEASLEIVKQKAENHGLSTIISIHGSENVDLPLETGSADVVLLFDVIHLIKERKKLYQEVQRVLKPGGMVSVFSKHHESHMEMKIEEVLREIKAFFTFDCALTTQLLHYNHVEYGKVYTFRNERET